MTQRELLGKAHRPSLDNMSPAQIRVVCEHFLFTMEFKARNDLMETYPGLYRQIYPDYDTYQGYVDRHLEKQNSPQV